LAASEIPISKWKIPALFQFKNSWRSSQFGCRAIYDRRIIARLNVKAGTRVEGRRTKSAGIVGGKISKFAILRRRTRRVSSARIAHQLFRRSRYRESDAFRRVSTCEQSRHSRASGRSDAGSVRLKERRNKREKRKPRFPRTTVLGTVRLKYGREFLCFYAEGEHVRRLRGITYGRTSIMRVSDFELTTRRPT